MSDDRRPTIVELATSDGTLKRSLITCAIVGTTLSLINQGDTLWAGEAPNLVKVGLNYLVPYCVATYGAVTAKQVALRRQSDVTIGHQE